MNRSIPSFGRGGSWSRGAPVPFKPITFMPDPSSRRCAAILRRRRPPATSGATTPTPPDPPRPHIRRQSRPPAPQFCGAPDCHQPPPSIGPSRRRFVAPPQRLAPPRPPGRSPDSVRPLLCLSDSCSASGRAAARRRPSGGPMSCGLIMFFVGSEFGVPGRQIGRDLSVQIMFSR